MQGLDYYYTLQGWLKGVNGTNSSNDPGGDGLGASLVGKDAFAFALGYHEGDYQGIGATPTTHQLWDRLQEQHGYRGLYNGNIAWMQTSLPGLKQQGLQSEQAMLYEYDQLNRLVQAQSLRNFSEASGFASRDNSPKAFDAAYSYDANGNLLTLQRYDAQADLMDDFTYQYQTGKNRLLSVEDAVVGETITYDHITYNSSPLNHNGKVYRTITVEDDVVVSPGQSPFLQANQSISLKQSFHAKAGSGFHAKWTDAPNEERGQGDNSTFTYDAIGNLISDSGEGTSIEWTPYGKVRTVTKTDGTVVHYRYDAAGNRVEKQVVSSDTSYVTRYIRDASGNVLAIYQNDSLTEQPIYGSSRLGVYKGGSEVGEQEYGHRRFELANHLGNVQVIVSDKILMEDSDGDGVSESKADVLASYAYYPYGGLMPGRVYDNGYRYGMMGFERDDEIKGTGKHYDFGGYGYDPQLARRWGPDPLEKKYPSLSPYSVFNNNPTIYKDVNGKDWEITTTFDNNGNKTIHVKLTAAVLDATTAQNVDLNRLKAAVTTQMINTYSVSFQEASEFGTSNLNEGLDRPANNIAYPTKLRNVDVIVDVNVRSIASESALKGNEHLIKIVDDNSSELSSTATAAVNKIGGTEVRIKESYVGDIISNTNKKTLVHELGHTLGLRHIDAKAETPGEVLSNFFGFEGNPQYRGPASSNPNNVMLRTYKPSANQANSEQINIAVDKYESNELNKK